MCGNPSVADGRNYKKSDKCNVKIVTILFVWIFNKKYYPIHQIYLFLSKSVSQIQITVLGFCDDRLFHCRKEYSIVVTNTNILTFNES